MGRTLFSLSSPALEPTIRTEPEPKIDICERWSTWNRFDPDSEDFFQGAQYEAFIDPVQLEREQREMAAMAAAEGAADSSDSSDSSDSDHGSPMAVGSDPAELIASAYTARTAPWDVSLPDTEWRLMSMDRATSPISYQHSVYSPRASRNTGQLQVNPPFIPPAAFREPTPTPGIERDAEASISPPRSPIVRRIVNITPISVSRIQIHPATRSPSPDSPASPSTPPPQTPATYRQQTSAMFTPSPPPSVTPRFYSWQHHPIPALPSSPTVVRGDRDGPLTNPRARMSLSHIDSPARIRVPNIVL